MFLLKMTTYFFHFQFFLFFSSRVYYFKSLFYCCEKTTGPRQLVRESIWLEACSQFQKVSPDHPTEECGSRQADIALEQYLRAYIGNSKDYHHWHTFSNKEQLPILPKQFHQLYTKHSSMWASGGNSYSNHHTRPLWKTFSLTLFQPF